MVRIHLPPPFKKICPESTFRQINSRCFKTSVLTAFFICLALRATHLTMGVDSLWVVALRFSTGGLRCSRSSALRAAVESTSKHINSRCFKTFVLTAFFYLSCASRSPSFDGRGFLVCGCLALLDRRSAMLTLVGTACRRRIHLQT